MTAIRADCTVMLFYSIKEWVGHQDFWDSEFTADQQMMINSQQITAQFNALGTFSYPKRTSWEVLAGLKMCIRDRLIAYITMADTGFAAQLTSGISKTVGNLLDLGQHYTPSIS